MDKIEILAVITIIAFILASACQDRRAEGISRSVDDVGPEQDYDAYWRPH